MAYQQTPGSTSTSAGGGQFSSDNSSGVSSYPIDYNTDQNTSGGYQYKAGVTGNIAGGGEYDNLDTVDSISYEQLAAQKAAEAKLSADSAKISAEISNASMLNAQNYAAYSSFSATAASNSAEQALSYQYNAEESAQSALQSANEAAALISHFTISTAFPSGGVENDVWFKVSY